ncbi:hypothetical protein [Blautia parvula]|uniref:Uncharacterized protein n=1 Tax=Blautia parvula TaxID=2877527 RepID=A0ABQ0C3N5_9FIRM
MKEIDKIRIKQWNQDNPYIQMKNLENVQPGYRVHTVNDDHHLYELPLETQNIILDWVFWNFYPAQKIYPHLTSDDLKEVLYKRTQIHLYNNQFKEAMLINGFWPRDPSELGISYPGKLSGNQDTGRWLSWNPDHWTPGTE